jgi:Domain of unknown function (DUF4185)
MGRRTVLVCVLVFLAQAVLLITMTGRGGAGEPHRVPIVVAAPAVVAAALAQRADELPGEPFDAGWTDSADDARAAVNDGTAVAAVLVDLSGTADTVLVNPTSDPTLNQAVVDRLTGVEKSQGRTVQVKTTSRGTAGDDASGRVRLFILLCGLVGFGVVVAISLVRGPVARSRGHGLARVLLLAVVSIVAVLGIQLLPATSLPGNDARLVALGAGYAFTMGLLTLAVEALAGLAGLAVVAAAYFVLSTPLITGTSHYLLPRPWPTLSPATPTGAAQEAATALAYLDPARALRPVLILATALVTATVLLVVARRFRIPAADGAPDEQDPDRRARFWRLRVMAVVAPLAAVMAAVIAFLPVGIVAAEPLPSVASETKCVQEGTPKNVEDINRLILDLQAGPALEGADVGADVKLQDGRFLFVFGDTLRDKEFGGPEFVRNSMLVWNHDCVAAVVPQNRGALIPDRGDGIGYWPMSFTLVSRTGYDLVTVSTQRVATSGAGAFDNLGPGLAVFVVERGGVPQFIDHEDVGPDDPSKTSPAWGAALAADNDWLYLYGTANPEQSFVFGFSVQVARVRPDEVLMTEKWRYWDGGSWQKDPGQADVLIPAEGGVSQTFSVFHRGDTWYAFSRADGDFGDKLTFWTAPAPTGPFTPSAPVGELATQATGEITYMPLAHPDLFSKKGSIVASYSRNNTDFDKVLKDPSRYRPQFLRVRLPN